MTIYNSELKINKVAVKYKSNDFALWVNGFEVDTDNMVQLCQVD